MYTLQRHRQVPGERTNHASEYWEGGEGEGRGRQRTDLADKGALPEIQRIKYSDLEYFSFKIRLDRRLLDRVRMERKT